MTNNQIPNSPNGLGGKMNLPARITYAGSKQTYYTFLLLADRERVQDAFRSYAYFRWLDDQLDCGEHAPQEKVALLERQKALLEACYRGDPPAQVSAEEQMLVDMVRNDTQEHSGLQIYLRNMMKVMAFDVERCGRVISQAELADYTHWLSTAVTEVLFHLIGHDDAPCGGETRYHAVNGAHIVHMLRDTVEDISSGYYNISAGVFRADRLSSEDFHSPAMRKWVYGRVKLARQYFKLGRQYIFSVKNARCRLAGFAYIARFEWMLRLIERDQYILRAEYPERKSLKAGLWMAWRVVAASLKLRWTSLGMGEPPGLTGLYEES